MNQFSRTELLIGKKSLETLQNSKVAIFGLGGVGSYAAESLARCGIKNLELIDNDIIEITNINRQIIALHSTIGQNKTDVTKKRILDINPNANIITHKIFYCSENLLNIFNNIDYVIDAIDTVSSKINLIEECYNKKIKIISAMGTANKLNPTMLKISDIFNTHICPLCKIIRHELRKKFIPSLKVVYSEEIPAITDKSNLNNHKILGSTPFVPAVAGLLLANEVVKDLIAKNN